VQSLEPTKQHYYTARDSGNNTRSTVVRTVYIQVEA
jgi:hypothetical protein